MARVLRWIAAVVVLVVLVAGVLYARRANPLGPLAGRQLTGEVVSEPVDDWSFSNEQMTIAIETRPAAPHSVTTVCFVHEGKLYVPAQDGSKKSWTHYAVADPRVRVKIGDKVYPGIATRVTDEALREPARQAARAKYNFPEQTTPPADIWLFRIDSPQASAALQDDVAAGNP